MDKTAETEKLPRVTKVAVSVIFDDVRKTVLVAKRAKGKQFGGKWEFIGGKVEKDESFQETAEREALEETGLVVKSLGVLGELRFEMEDDNYDVTFFECEIKKGGYEEMKVNPREHDEFDWVKLEKLEDLDWIGENKKFAQWLVNFSRIRHPISGD